MHVKISNTAQFRFTQPKFNFGQRVETEDGLSGYIVGLDFYPETSVWAYGVYIVNRQNELVEELWYEADQLTELEAEANFPPKQRRYQVKSGVRQALQPV